MFITHTNCITSIGNNLTATIESIKNEISGISPSNKFAQLGTIYTSQLDDSLLQDINTLYFSRLEKYLIEVIKPLIDKKPISEKSVLIISSTKGNISNLTNTLTNPSEVNLGMMAKRINKYLGFKTEPIVVSNACVSGLQAISVAKRMLEFDYCDEVYIIAGDEISDFVLSGFMSFQAMSDQPCRPYDIDRNGINLGEAVTAMRISKSKQEALVEILADSTINDANHISGPSRTGEGLYRSIYNILQQTNIDKYAIDFISSHGTATVYNDQMEAIAFDRLKLNHIPIFSLKGYFGHTLGAAGLLETIISIECMKQQIIPRSLGFQTLGDFPFINVTTNTIKKQSNVFMKTASGFGGTNAAILFKNII